MKIVDSHTCTCFYSVIFIHIFIITKYVVKYSTSFILYSFLFSLFWLFKKYCVSLDIAMAMMAYTWKQFAQGWIFNSPANHSCIPFLIYIWPTAENVLSVIVYDYPDLKRVISKLMNASSCIAATIQSRINWRNVWLYTQLTSACFGIICTQFISHMITFCYRSRLTILLTLAALTIWIFATWCHW